MKRILTALALLPIAIFAVYFAPWWGFVAIVAGVAGICFYEYAGIVRAHGIDPPGIAAFVAGVLILLNPTPVMLVAAAMLTLAMRVDDLASYLPAAGASVLGVIYIWGGWRAAVELQALSPQWLFFALAINWVGDICAYYVGRAVGRRKLAPRISPGKSWEGTFGSMAGAVVFGMLFRPLLGISLIEVAVLSVLGNVAGQIGDLAESAMKRGAGVKDSGSTLPGHGGWLDRLDSSLFSMPVVYWVHVALARVPH